MTNVNAGLSVRDLAEQADTTVRTIHYYIAEGLLPPPQGTKRNANYTVAHLARLRLIAALRDEGLALAGIRQRLAPLSDEQAVDVMRELETHLNESATPLTTLGLIEAVLATRAVGDERLEPETIALSAPIAAVSEGVSYAYDLQAQSDATETASDYLRRVLRRPATGAPQPHPLPVPPPRTHPPPRKPLDDDRPEAWYHFRIEDGVELRVREDRYREARGRLRAVIDSLRATLRRYNLPPDDSS